MEDINHYKKRVYYAQNREDLILRAFFPDVTDGFYVDVGGYDPDFESVTKYFYQHGWRGINIEPQPENYKRFVKKRSRDINVNKGISDASGKLELRSYANGGLSTFSKNMKDQYVADTSDDTNTYTDITVDVTTLSALLNEHKVKKIHFMKVDVEGLEGKVLKGNDWSKFRPEVICIEANHIDEDWHKLLKSYDYKKVFFDGLNEYHVDTKTNREEQFDYVKSVVLEKGGGINTVDFEVLVKTRKELEEQNSYAKHLLGEVAKRDAVIKDQRARLLHAEGILTSVKASQKHVASLLKHKIKAGNE